MSAHRLKIKDFDGVAIVYSQWIESVQVKGESQEVYLTFAPRLKRIWLRVEKKRMPNYVAQNPANTGLRSKYSLRLYAWAKRHSAVGAKRITMEESRKLLGLESVKDADGNIIREAPLPIWANFRQRALDTAIAEINKKTDLHVEIKTLEKLSTRVNALNFSIIPQERTKSGRPS